MKMIRYSDTVSSLLLTVTLIQIPNVTVTVKALIFQQMRRFLTEAKFQRHHNRLLRDRSVSRRLKALKRLMLDAKGVEASFYRKDAI